MIEWGTWSRAERESLRAEAAGLGVKTELHHLHASVPELYRRVRARTMESAPITLAQMHGWAALFETPTPEEAARFDAFLQLGV